ncbi:hypothetical protein VNO80_06092 [Phaseolus coccineus]|uniref:Uncharacterized protein n=1 Tax=Phaseolus coccineus TaxID=3886 RepID=A0AAN9NG99_PHACN
MVLVHQSHGRHLHLNWIDRRENDGERINKGMAATNVGVGLIRRRSLSLAFQEENRIEECYPPFIPSTLIYLPTRITTG